MVSIIMPAYNADPYIKSAIESVLSQTYNNWELIVINDGSTDDTEKIINEYNDTRIKYFSQKNNGVGNARNVGLKNMKGDFFCFLDADDYLPPQSLEYRVNKLMRNSDIDFLDGTVEIYDQDLRNKTNYWKPSFKGNPLIPLINISSSCFFSPTWMIRKIPARTYHFNENITHGEDLLFFIELSLIGGKYDYVDETILHYRKGHNSAMTNLKGLENGYHFISNALKDYKEISPDQVQTFNKKARKIMLKSYLGNFQVINALLCYLKKWQNK